jgi:hypothetical protein
VSQNWHDVDLQSWNSLGTIKDRKLMTVQLDWPSDVVDRLTQEARNKGLSLDDYVLQTVLQQNGSNGVSATDEAEKRRKLQEAAASIRALRKGNILGPGLSIRDLIEEGRRF